MHVSSTCCGKPVNNLWTLRFTDGLPTDSMEAGTFELLEIIFEKPLTSQISHCGAVHLKNGNIRVQ